MGYIQYMIAISSSIYAKYNRGIKQSTHRGAVMCGGNVGRDLEAV